MTVIEKCLLCRNAVFSLSSSEGQVRNAVLRSMANLLWENKDFILTENRKDIEKAEENGIKKAMVDRLALNDKRIKDICDSVLEVISLPTRWGREVWSRPNGLEIQKSRYPSGLSE